MRHQKLTSLKHDNENNEEGEGSNTDYDSEDRKLFFTTSDLMEVMNRVGDGNFELQRRMPDGTTRKADESDIALSDFQSKIKQVCIFLLSNIKLNTVIAKVFFDLVKILIQKIFYCGFYKFDFLL